MMLLKGFGLSQYYPEAKLRTPGDVDVYLFGDWKKADDAVREELGVTVCKDSEHHTTFVLNGVMVENHYDFVNTRIRKSSKRLEKIIKELAQDKTNVIDVRGQKAKEYNMHRFLACLNMICVEDLGLDGLKFNMRYVYQQLKARVLKEIMQGTDLVPGASAWERTKRWWQHRWKHEICYSDSMSSSFVYSVRVNLTGMSIEKK